jgi:methionyl-tRNA synthetase
MKSYITTPIFYVNAAPHLGHAYTSIVADTYNRFRKIAGYTSRFQTGTDEHGDKIAEAAANSGVTPKEYADRISRQFQDTWPPLNVEPDNFIRTTDPKHIAVVQSILQKIYDQGDIVFSDYTGLYCQGCERFLTEKELVDGLCPDHKKAPEEISEKNYFFKMSRYQDWLIDHLKNNSDFVTPERYKNEVLSFLKEPLTDLCISRPTSRLTWGIPLPFDNNYVTYVWFDALINYLTGLGYSPDGRHADLFRDFWPVAEHIIAKDILKPHAIFWPTMLKAMGLEPYQKLHVHGYWNVDDTKMSKSLGNIIKPLELVADYGVDTVRYFLLREMSFGLDSSFSTEALITRQNSDLANDLGNLFSRSLAMVKKFTGNQIPEPPKEMTELDEKLKRRANKMIVSVQRNMGDFSFNKALQNIWEVVSKANKYIVENAPWTLAKDPDKKERLQAVIYNLLETLRMISLPLHAVMPDTARKMFDALGIDAEPDFASMGEWGANLKPGTDLGEVPPLFPRLEQKRKTESEAQKRGDSGKPASAAQEKRKSASPKKSGPAPQVTFDDFLRLDLKVATVKAAEKIPKSDRLLKLTVLAPEERTIVAGIAEHYEPEQIVGKQVIIVANLQPVMLMGVESHGMVLAAKNDGKLVLSSVTDEIPAGSKVA